MVWTEDITEVWYGTHTLHILFAGFDADAETVTKAVASFAGKTPKTLQIIVERTAGTTDLIQVDVEARQQSSSLLNIACITDAVMPHPHTIKVCGHNSFKFTVTKVGTGNTLDLHTSWRFD